MSGQKHVVLFGSAWRSNEPTCALGPFDSKELARAAIGDLMGEVPGGFREDGVYGIFPIASSIEELRAYPGTFDVAWNDSDEDS